MSNDIRAVCVIGWPVAHSRSPLIHNFWIGQHALKGEYRREAVKPEEFETFIKELSQRGYAGANVTIPHKEVALKLSEPDDRALAVGAANTLWFEGETLRSTNTDVEGFLANLDQMAPGWDRGLDDATCAWRRRGGTRHRFRASFTRRDKHPCRQPHLCAGAGLARTLRRQR